MDAHELVGRLASGEGISPQEEADFHQGIRWQTQWTTAHQVVLENGWRATAQQVQAALWEKHLHAASVEECREAMASLQKIDGFQERFETLRGTREDFIRELMRERQKELFSE